MVLKVKEEKRGVKFEKLGKMVSCFNLINTTIALIICSLG